MNMRITMNRWMTAAAVSLLAVSLAQAAPTNLTPFENSVRHELVMLPYYGVFDNITFQVSGTQVTLTGQVTRPVLKNDAGNVVARIAGVSKVNNQIEVLPLSPFDDSIRIRAYRAIYGNPVLSRYSMVPIAPIRIIVNHGNVTLDGVVSTEMAKDVAAIEASGISGVFSVTNNLRVGS
jgi:hyperosmotically inducible periplasmic protein